MANLFATANKTIAPKVIKAEVTIPSPQYVPIGYINEMDEPVICNCNMTAQKLQYCNLSGFTILFKKV